MNPRDQLERAYSQCEQIPTDESVDSLAHRLNDVVQLEVLEHGYGGHIDGAVATARVALATAELLRDGAMHPKAAARIVLLASSETQQLLQRAEIDRRRS